MTPDEQLIAAGWTRIETKNPFCWREPRPGYKAGGGLWTEDGALRRLTERQNKEQLSSNP